MWSLNLSSRTQRTAFRTTLHPHKIHERAFLETSKVKNPGIFEACVYDESKWYGSFQRANTRAKKRCNMRPAIFMTQGTMNFPGYNSAENRLPLSYTSAESRIGNSCLTDNTLQ